MLRTVLAAMLAVTFTATNSAAQAVTAYRSQPDSLRSARAIFLAEGSANSHGTIGAVVGGLAGIAAGLYIGHGANVGCKTSGCDAEAKQVKVMVVSAVILGGIGARLGYVAGRRWPSHQADSAGVQRNDSNRKRIRRGGHGRDTAGP